MNRNVRLFDRISWLYGLFYKRQVKAFKKRFLPNIPEDVLGCETVLDVGGGTGALGTVLYDAGFKVTVLDASSDMLNVAKVKVGSRKIEFIQSDFSKEVFFSEGVFDFVVASYVLHGLDKKTRYQVYKNMKDVAKIKVLIYEHSGEGSLLIPIVEKLEGGDYVNFVRDGETEMRSIFKKVHRVKISKKTVLYVCEV